jgi:hypothetical protein
MTAAYLSASTLVTREFHDHEGFACYLMQILRDHGLIIDLSCPNDERTGQNGTTTAPKNSGYVTVGQRRDPD